MLASILIITISLVLFVYWFRYTCFLILSSDSSRNYASQIASANHLSFPDTQLALSGSGVDQGISTRALDSLHRSLDRDFQLLSYLLTHVATYQTASPFFQNRLLAIDYFLITVWYRVVRGTSDRLARVALLEMSFIVEHLAHTMGKQVSTCGSS